MKQVIRKGLKNIIVDEVPDPVLIPHHVLIQPIVSLISSGTETASIHQEGVLRAVAENPSQLGRIWQAMKAEGPLRTAVEVKAKLNEYAVLGYSGAGVVVDKHPTVVDLEIGDRVAYGGEGTGHAEIIRTGRNLTVKVPDSVSYAQASFATLGSIALNAVRIARLELGETVAVIGLGLVGQLIAQLAKLQGGRVLAVDLKQDRIELAQRLGAEHSLLAGTAQQTVAATTDGKGVDCVMVAAATKSASPCQQAVEICRDRGRIIDVGAVELSFPWYEMYRKEIQLSMARAYGPGSYDPVYEEQGQDYPLPYVRWTENRNMEEFLRLVALGRVALEPLITHQFPLEKAEQAYQTIMDPASGTLAVLLNYPAAANLPRQRATFAPRRRVEVTSPSKTRSQIGVGVAGAGNLARWVHLPNLQKLPNTRLRAVYSANGVRGKSYALRFGADYCCSDYEEILKDDDIDVVVIVSRNQHHASQALAALQAGKHVFLEKPMALTVQECRSLYHAVEESGRQLSVGFNRRFAPFYLGLKRQLLGRIGPAVLNVRVNSPGISGGYWMADPSIGGAILGEACHFVDLMFWLLGAEPVSVSAFMLPSGLKEPIAENNLVTSFRFADGSIGNLTYSTVGSRTSGGERVEVFAPGLAAISEDFKRLTVRTRLVKKQSSWFAEKGYRNQLEGFFASVREGKSPEVTVRDGARATIVCLRMLESARTLAPCTINWEQELLESKQ